MVGYRRPAAGYQHAICGRIRGFEAMRTRAGAPFDKSKTAASGPMERDLVGSDANAHGHTPRAKERRARQSGVHPQARGTSNRSLRRSQEQGPGLSPVRNLLQINRRPQSKSNASSRPPVIERRNREGRTLPEMLFHFNRSADIREFLSDRLGLVLVNAFLDRLGSAVHQVLGLF
jgi:hypothetical protein